MGSQIVTHSGRARGVRGCTGRVQARQIQEEFRVNTLEGNYKKGKAGDYLMRGVDAELYICDKDIFEKTYDFITNKEAF